VIRVRYTGRGKSSAPVLAVILAHPDGPPAGEQVAALLDTGADRTVIPLPAAEVLALQLVNEMRVEVAGGSVILFPVYEVSIRIDGVMDFILEVVAADEPRVLLGRDVLNCLHTHLDGPGRILTLSAQPPLPPTP
jgi:predicted aspartyl protease